MYDILIKGGTVIDGTGKPGFGADLAIQDGKIAKIGTLADAAAGSVIDAGGRYVMPGFIDVTNHSDVAAALFEIPTLDSLLLQGITTIIGGNCGTSLAPLTDPDIIHEIRKWAPTSSINVNWLSVAEYLKEVENLRLAVNYGTLVGHGTLRRGVAREAVRPLTLEELAEVKEMLKKALREGALGLSTNLSSSHEYPATADELTEMAKVLAVEGGVYKTHLRSEGADLISALNEAIRVGAEAGTAVSISHLKAIGRKAWPMMRRGLRMIENASRGGRRIAFDLTPYVTTGSQLSTLMPQWVREGGFGAMTQRLRDGALQRRLLSDLEPLSLHYDRITVSEAEDGVSPGHTLAELAARMNAAPSEALIQLLLANRGRVSIVGHTLNSKSVEAGIRNERAMIASNGSAHRFDETASEFPHPRSFGAFPHFLHKYARDKQALSWEAAVAKITSFPAEFFGIKNRGILREHYAADVVVLEPEKLRDRATYRNPFQRPRGIAAVIVNGVVAAREGTLTAARPGQVIRKA